MDFLKNNKALITLGLAVVLAALAAFSKVDVPALLGSVTTINKQVGGLVDEVAPAPVVAPKPE